MKKKSIKKIRKENLFTSAGSLKYVGKPYKDEISTQLIQYNSNDIKQKSLSFAESLSKNISPTFVNWIDVKGIQNTEKIGQIGQEFQLHPLLLEDLLNTTQKTKIEIFEEEKRIFVILKLPYLNYADKDIEFNHITLILDENTVLSFQEMERNDIFDSIIKRLNSEGSKTRNFGPDYLFYSMIDLIVDNYFPISSSIEEILSELEFEILNDAKPSHQKKLFYLKKELSELKNNLRPTKEIMNQLLRVGDGLISDKVKLYLRDILDHVNENLESIDSFREEIENLSNTYHAQLSDKMNTVMKTLTIFTSIFMPITFIAGIYGMNFQNMPELHSQNGYYFTLLVMLFVAVLLWAYFKWKKYF